MSELANLLNSAIENKLNQLYTAMPATIKSYSLGKADVIPSVMIEGEIPLPVITNVPVVFPHSKTSGVVFELTAGDSVLVVFSTASLDEWLNGSGAVSSTDDSRRNDLSDAVAIPGLFPFAQAPKLAPTDGLVVSHNQTSITLKKSGDVEIGGTGAKKLLTETFVNFYNNHTHQSASPGSPTGTPTPPVVAATVTTQKTSAL